MRLTPPAGWVPIAIRSTPAGSVVDWCDLRGCPLSAPFFDTSVTAWLARPYPLLFQHTTPLAALAELSVEPPPAGLVFHLSRCGSTLVSQLLALAPGNASVSEPGVLGSLLRHTGRGAGWSEADRVTLLRGLLAALARPWGAHVERVYLKLDVCQALLLPLFLEAAPRTPRVFLYREPVEVLVSVDRRAGRHFLPGVVDPALLGLDDHAAFAMDTTEYQARLLGGICAAAVAHHDPARTHLMRYDDLPAAVWTDLPAHFGFPCDAAVIRRMRERSEQRGKQPGVPFAGDRQEKWRDASPAIVGAAERFIRAPFERLEALRSGARGTTA